MAEYDKLVRANRGLPDTEEILAIRRQANAQLGALKPALAPVSNVVWGAVSITALAVVTLILGIAALAVGAKTTAASPDDVVYSGARTLALVATVGAGLVAVGAVVVLAVALFRQGQGL